jgi:predicted short-subunit dehydrogenase-like oxidoreductase (DUF2520 family)
MSKLRAVALLCSGPVSRSPVTRLPNLRRYLAWVKSSSFHASSRAVNALGAGTPVLHANDAKRAGIWVVSVASAELPSALSELRSATLEWTGRTLLILDSMAESCVAEEFRHSGAAVATFAPIDPEASRYVVEGDADAVGMARSLIEDSRVRRVIEIKKGAKTRYLAGAQAATQNILPFVAEAVECFQSAGLSMPESKSLAETLLTGAMRSYFRAGRRAIKS